MTIVVGYKTSTNYYIGSDGQSTAGIHIAQRDCNKIHKFDNFLLGFCGNITEITKFWAHFPQDQLYIYNEDDIYAFADNVINKVNPQPQSFGTMIVCSFGIYIISYFTKKKFQISRYKQWATLGSGCYYANPLIDYLHKQKIEPKTIIKTTINQTSKYDTYCGGKTKILINSMKK